MLQAVPFRQKVQINKSIADMPNNETTEDSASLHLAGPGSKCTLDEIKRKWQRLPQ